tara:strand:- start:241 stop:1041 length:801 start_codon:yes stop_codon:yes gene_type:complete
VEEVRLLLWATLIGIATAGAIYAGVKLEQPTEVRVGIVADLDFDPETDDAVAAGEVAEIPVGAEAPGQDELDRLDEVEWRAWLEGMDLVAANAEEMALGAGVRLGPLEMVDEEAEAAARANARRRARPRVPPGPRLHPDPGMHSILVAKRMITSGERIQGSCYAYLSEVYARAGHSSWRKRTIVHRGERNGPYADLDLIRPGDWLYIVNDPYRTPVGTHSVMFLGWQDRARGVARTISHAGWGAPRVGRESTYDISRTYRIVRPTL